MTQTAGQIIARALKAYGVPYVTGLPGHGNWSLLDAFLDDGCELPFVQVFHEQSAVHIADAHYRVTGQPIAATTSIGPGAANTVIGLATAHADSTSLLLLTGSTATHMRSHGVMQGLDRFHFPSVTAPVTKRNFEMVRAIEAPFLMHRAFNAMLSGRRGPVHIEIPLDVQVEQADVQIADLKPRLPLGRPRADEDSVLAACKMLLTAERPCIVAGGGAVMSDAAPELASLAEQLGIPVVYTWNGKGALSDEHPLNAGTAGWPGSLPGNTLAANAASCCRWGANSPTGHPRRGVRELLSHCLPASSSRWTSTRTRSARTIPPRWVSPPTSNLRWLTSWPLFPRLRPTERSGRENHIWTSWPGSRRDGSRY